MITPKQWLMRRFNFALEQDLVGVTAFLRRHRPIIPLPGFTTVVRNADVREVMGCRETFRVVYGPKMRKISGPFALGLDDTTDYAVARRILDQTLLVGDVDRIRTQTAELAEVKVDAALGQGRIDVVSELADPVLAEVVSDHLGVPAPDHAVFCEWTRAIFEEIFQNDLNAADLARRADAAGPALRADIAQAVENGPHGRDTAVDRLLAARAGNPDLTEASTIGNVLGLAVAWIPNSSKSFTLALEQLLERPDALAQAQAAAREDDDARLEACLFEALRFRPQNSGVLRMCARDHELAPGTPRARMLKEGTPILALTKSAMMDEEVLERPDEFRTDRSPYDYLHFGYGRHTCLGEPVARAQLPAMAKPLLRLAGIARAPGVPGRVRWRGTFPSNLTVALRP